MYKLYWHAHVFYMHTPLENHFSEKMCVLYIAQYGRCILNTGTESGKSITENYFKIYMT